MKLHITVLSIILLSIIVNIFRLLWLTVAILVLGLLLLVSTTHKNLAGSLLVRCVRWFMWLPVSFISFIIMAWALYLAIYTNKTVPGWTSNIVSTVFLSGIQLIVLGIIGEYLGKLFIENKRRPNYIIEEMSLKVQGSKFQVQGLKHDNQKHEAIAESRFVGKEQETLNSEL